MLIQDIQQLDKGERRALDESFHPELTKRKPRGIALSALVALTGVVLFAWFGVSAIFFAGLTSATVLVSAIEKITYQRAMLRYESMIRKLVNRIEVLEEVPQSPPTSEDSDPTIWVTRKIGEDTHTAKWSAERRNTDRWLFL